MSKCWKVTVTRDFAANTGGTKTILQGQVSFVYKIKQAVKGGTEGVHGYPEAVQEL